MLNTFLTTSILIAHTCIILALLWGSYTLIKKKPFIPRKYHNHIQKHGLNLGLFLSVSAILGSLYYSQILLLPPCELCWYQRITIFPQALLFGYATFLNDKKYAPRYILALSLIGIPIALIQYLSQFSSKVALSCGIAEAGGCSTILIKAYGYITIPMMSLTFLIISALLAFALLYTNR